MRMRNKTDKRSAGIIVFRFARRSLEILLIHPGGPFWGKKDEGSWSIPKGIYENDEEPLTAARREFQEETGFIADGEFLELGTFTQPSGKTISAWALLGDFDTNKFESNTFSMEWPPKSGRMQEFSEADRAGWFEINEARRKITKGQLPIIEMLVKRLIELGLLSK